MTSIPGRDALPEWLLPLARAAGGVRAEELAVHFRPPQGGGRESAVLVLFASGPAGPDVLLTERAADLRSHAGQPAFPGGAVEPDDTGTVHTALREAAEETGLVPESVHVFGTLPELWIRPSEFRVTPVLAWWEEPGDVRPADPAEVAAVARVPIHDLTNPGNRSCVRHPSGYIGPAFQVGGMLVWGFTGSLLDWLLRLGGWERPWETAPVQDLDL